MPTVLPVLAASSAVCRAQVGSFFVIERRFSRIEESAAKLHEYNGLIFILNTLLVSPWVMSHSSPIESCVAVNTSFVLFHCFKKMEHSKGPFLFVVVVGS